MSRGSHSLPDTSVARFNPSKLEIWIDLRLASDQYKFLPIQSKAIPSGVVKFVSITNFVSENYYNWN